MHHYTLCALLQIYVHTALCLLQDAQLKAAHMRLTSQQQSGSSVPFQAGLQQFVSLQDAQLKASQAQLSSQHSGESMPFQAGFQQRWPDILGCLLCPTGLPKVSLQNGRTCPIIATYGQGDEQRPDVACFCLNPDKALCLDPS